MFGSTRLWPLWTLCVIICCVATCSSLRILLTAAGESSSQPDSLRLTWLANSSLTCNDGTPAGYYIRRGSSSHLVIYLEGGGYCWDGASCRARWRRRPALMSSARWPRARRAPALLSADPAANPLWHASTHVLLPYCSSDMWAGTRLRTANDSFAFAGHLIVRAVLGELLRLGLSGRLLLVGSSAGAAGVMLHADGARRLLRPAGVRVAAVADSGWFLDRPPRGRALALLLRLSAVPAHQDAAVRVPVPVRLGPADGGGGAGAAHARAVGRGARDRRCHPGEPAERAGNVCAGVHRARGAGAAGVAGDQRVGRVAAARACVLGGARGWSAAAGAGAVRTAPAGGAVLVAAVQRLVPAAARPAHGRGGGAVGAAAELRAGRAGRGGRHGAGRARAVPHEPRRAAAAAGAAHVTRT